MSTDPVNRSAQPALAPASELHCHRCGYDLRVHAPDTVCPECGTSVAESVREALLPKDPDWRDRDPRWRRRVLAGVWVLLMLPLMSVLDRAGVLGLVPAPTARWSLGTVETLADTMLAWAWLYPSVTFGAGVAMLFARERTALPRPSGRRIRLFGLSSAWVTFVVGLSGVLFIVSLVMAGLSALFMSIPLGYQPPFTGGFTQVSFLMLRYGPHPDTASSYVAVVASSLAVLLGCVVLHDALWSTLRGRPRVGPARHRRRAWTALPLGCLVLFAVLQIVEAGCAALGLTNAVPLFGGFSRRQAITTYTLYFRHELLLDWIFRGGPGMSPAVFFGGPVAEALKWLSLLCVALWLTVAQFLSYRKPRRVSGPRPEGT